MSSALVNRMFHVELAANSRVWLEWAAQNGIHRFVYDYICSRPDHLWAQPPKTEEPFSTPRSWEMLSDILHSYGEDIPESTLSLCAYGCLTAAHATQFIAYVRQVRSKYSLKKILDGTQKWPGKPEERDVLYFLAQSFRSQLIKELPESRSKLSGESMALAFRAKELLIELAEISLEIAQMSITPEDGTDLPNWFVVEAAKDIPRLLRKRE